MSPQGPRTVGRAGRACLGAALLLATPPARGAPDAGALVIGWGDLGPLFRARYNARSPSRNAHLAAALREVIGGGFRFDPVASGTVERDAVATSAETHTSTVKLSQGSPWGTAVDVHKSETRLVGRDAGFDPANPQATSPGTQQGVAVKQELLRGGLYNGLSPGRSASAKRTLDELDAVIDFDTAFHKAISSLLAAQRAARYLTAADQSLTRAKTENAAVSALVTAGYKAKADQLISGASEVRAKLRVERASRDRENAGRDLANALWQTAQDPPLTVSTEPVPDGVVQRLAALRWPDEPTALARERVNVDVAAAATDLAQRQSLPDLSVQLSVDRYRPPGGGAYAPGIQKSGVLALSVPLVSSVTREEVRLAQLDQTAAAARFSVKASELRTERETLTQKIALAQISLKAAQDLLDYALQTGQLEMQKYRDGKSTINDLRRAQEDEDAAELAVIDATSDLLQARLDFGLAAGVIGEVLK